MYDSCCPIQYQVHLSVPLFFYGLGLAFLYSVYLFLISSHKSLKFVDLTIFYGAYSSFSLFAFYLKDYLADSTCQGRPNSVSGHTFFNFFFFSNFLIRFLSLGKDKTLFHKLFLFIVETLFLVNSTLTYLGGYHTPRQMLYGILLGVFVVILFNAFKAMLSRRTNLLFYMGNLLLWLYVATQFSSVKPSFNLIVSPALFSLVFCLIAYYVERKEIQKLE